MDYYIHLGTGLREHQKNGNGGMHCRKKGYTDNWMAGGTFTLYGDRDNGRGFEGLCMAGRLDRVMFPFVGGKPWCIGEVMAFCN
jgi:hypothetical protein